MKPEYSPDKEPQDDGGQHSAGLPGWLVMLGGIPLVLAMLVEFITVVGRHTGFMFLGSIEAVQAAILLSSATAMVLATLARSHAKVRVLLNRSDGRFRKVLTVLNALCGMLFFLALTAGSVWLAIDMWRAHEQSELLALPYFPLRCFVCLSMAVVAVLYARRLLAAVRESGTEE